MKITMTKKIRLILIGVGIFLGLMILIPAALLFYLETDHAQSRIQAKVNKAIPGTISWEKFHFSLVRGKFELKNALLRGPSDEKLAGFDRLFINLSWLTLFQKNLTVEDLTLEKPWAWLRKNKDGKLNLTEAFPPSKPQKEKKKEKSSGLPVNIVVSSLKLENGSVRYQADAQDLNATVQDFDVTGNGNLLKQSGHLSFQITNAEIDSPEIQTRADHLRIETSVSEGRVDPFVVKLGVTDATTLALSGNVNNVFNEPFLDLNLDLAASLPEIRESLRMKPELTGNAELHLTAKGTLNNPEVTLRLDYGGGNLAGNQIDRIDLDCYLADRRVVLYNLKAEAASGNLNLQGEADLQKAFAKGFLSRERDLEAISYKLSLKQNKINLAELTALRDKIKGTVNTDLSVHGQGISPETMSAKLVLSLFAEQLTTDSIAPPVDVRLDTKANLEQGLATIKELDAQAGDIRLRTDGTFHLTSKDIAANLTLDAPNLAASLTPLGVKNVHGALALKTHVSGLVSQPAFDCALQGNQLRFQDITIGNVKLDAALDPSGILQVSQLDLENQGSVLQGGGTVQIFKKDSLTVESDFPSDFSLTLRNVETKDFFKKAIADGAINGKLSIKGNLSSPAADCALEGKHLRFQDITIGNVKLDAVLDQTGKLQVSQLGLENQGSSLQGRGWVQIFKKGSLKVDSAFPSDFSLVLRDIETKDFLKQAIAAGVIDGTLDLKGNLGALDATLSLQGKKLAFDNMGLDHLSLTADLGGSMRHLTGTVSLEGKKIDLGAQKLSGIRLLSELDGKKIGINSLQIAVTPKETIEGTGWVSLVDKAYQMDLKSKGISLENIDKVREQNIATGKMLLNISGNGTFENPRVDGEIALKNLRVKEKPMDDFQVHLTIQDHLGRVSGKLNFDIDGYFHLQKKIFLPLFCLIRPTWLLTSDLRNKRI